MATAATKNGEDFNCSICVDKFEHPKKLPSCSHTFCKRCIVGYLLHSVKTTKDADEMSCPLCKAVITPPRNEEEIPNWVEALETNEEVEGLGEVTVLKANGQDHDSSFSEFCISCKESGKVSKSTRFCLECGEHLCKNCCDIGHRFAPLRNHYVIELDTEIISSAKEMKVVQTLSKYLICHNHPGQILTHVRTSDCSLCCLTCAAEDTNETIEILEYVTKEANEKEHMKIMTRISNLVTVSKAIIRSKHDEEAENKRSTESIETHIREMRRKVNDLFDNLEVNIKQQCKALTKKYSLAATEDLEKVQGVVNNLEFHRLILERCKERNSQRLLFVVQHYLQNQIREEENTIMDLQRRCTKSTFELRVQEQLGYMSELDANKTDELAVVNEIKKEVPLPKFGERSIVMDGLIGTAVHYKALIPEGVDKSPFYTGIVCLPSSRLLLVDNTNGISCLVNSDCKVVKTCMIRSKYDILQLGETLSRSAVIQHGETSISYTEFDEMRPVDVAVLNDGTAAISIPAKKKLIFISTEKTFRILSEVHTKKKPFALCGLANGLLAITWKEPWSFGIIKFSKHGRFEETLQITQDKNGRVFKTFRYVTVDESRSHVIQPCLFDKAVYCFDFEGNPKFCYKHSELVFPQGVALDSVGDIFVCDSKTSCVHVLSATGLGIHRITAPEGHLYWPIVVAISNDDSQITVIHGSMKEQKLSVFPLTQNV